MAMSYENIIVETRGRVGLIRLNRPQALNALNSALIADVSRAVEAFDADANIGCMVITGSEKAFAAGADIKQMANQSFIEAYMGNFAAHWDRVANARKALSGQYQGLLDPAILLLDDPTAAVDPETEKEILEAIENAMRGRTTFMVANRISSLRRADRIIVLEDGRIVQVGTHEELVRTDGPYRRTAELQFATT